MNITELKNLLAGNADKTVRFVLPNGSNIPPHAHVTEVAQIDKRFIDCGGTQRTESLCRLQTWYADDTEHRLSGGKLLKILELSRSIITNDSLEVEIEHEAPFISQFPIAKIEARADSLVFHLGLKHTDCLAKDKCGVPQPSVALDFPSLPSLKETACCAWNC